MEVRKPKIRLEKECLTNPDNPMFIRKSEIAGNICSVSLFLTN